jgi:hypothetical protein
LLPIYVDRHRVQAYDCATKELIDFLTGISVLRGGFSHHFSRSEIEGASHSRHYSFEARERRAGVSALVFAQQPVIDIFRANHARQRRIEVCQRHITSLPQVTKRIVTI